MNLYLVGLFLRIIVMSIIIIMKDFKSDNQKFGIVLISLQVIIFKLPLFLFFYILFKMKKIEILLDYNQAFDR